MAVCFIALDRRIPIILIPLTLPTGPLHRDCDIVDHHAGFTSGLRMKGAAPLGD